MQQSHQMMQSQYNQALAAAQNAVNMHGIGWAGISTISSVAPVGLGWTTMPVAQVPAKPLETGMKAEDLIGWRIWSVHGGYLKSFSADSLWLPDTPMTGKPLDHDDAGVWAFKDKARAIKKAIESSRDGSSYAVGSVKLWGTVIEHSDGYRAASARVMSIDDVIAGKGTDWLMLAQLRERYGFDDGGEAREHAARPAPPVLLSESAVPYPDLRLTKSLLYGAALFNFAFGMWNFIRFLS